MKFLTFLGFLALAFVIMLLCGSEAYQKRIATPLKAIIAIVLSCVSFVFCPEMASSLYAFSMGWLGSDGGIFATLYGIFFSFVKAAVPIAVGILVYYRLCPQKRWARRIGYVLFGLMTAIAVLIVMLAAISGDILGCIANIAGIVLGSFILKDLHTNMVNKEDGEYEGADNS